MLETSRAIRRNVMLSTAVIMMLGGTMVAWAVYAPIEGAVVAPAIVTVEGSVKKVQHQTGGVVETLYAREGQQVTAGDPLVLLDSTLLRANLGVVTNEMRAVQARLARLQAERDGRQTLLFEEYGVSIALDDREWLEVLKSERAVFQTRQRSLSGQKLQLRERIAQLHQEIEGFTQQSNALKQQLVIGREELKDLEGLLEKGLAQRPRVSGLQKEVLRSEGLIGELSAKMAQSRGKIGEIELQILQLDQDLMKDIAREIRESEIKLSELLERRAAAEDQLRRTLIRAPATGFVHQLSIHTVGGVIGPGEQVLLVVPTSGDLIIEGRVAPQDIDQVKQGQPARVRFPALASQQTQELNGEVFRVGADLTKEASTGQAYFTVGIRLAVDELRKLEGFRLTPGMPAEAFIKTGERTMASYLLKPVTDQFARAMRER